MTDDEVKALAEKLGEYRLLIRQEGMVGITYKPLSDLLDKQIIEALARVALDDCEERITETVNAYIRAVNKMYAIEAERLITGELKIEIKGEPK